MRSRNTTSGNKKVCNFLGYHYSIRNIVAALSFSDPVEIRTHRIVDIDGICTYGYAVIVLLAIENHIRIECFNTNNTTALPNTRCRSNCFDAGISKSRNVLLQEGHYNINLLMRLNLRFRPLCAIHTRKLGHTGHIDDNFTRMYTLEEEHAISGQREISVFPCLLNQAKETGYGKVLVQVAILIQNELLRVLMHIFHSFLQIDILYTKHQCHRLRHTIVFTTKHEVCTGSCCQVCIAAGINEHLAFVGFHATFV